MKLEMNANTMVAINTASVCVAVIVIAFLAYRYNIAVYEKGYTQKQLEHSQMTMWVKEP